jgi:hypothetical protein
MAKIKEAIEDLPDRRRIEVWLEPTDIEIIDGMERRFGCSTAAALRACIRIAADVKLSLDRPAPINSE